MSMEIVISFGRMKDKSGKLVGLYLVFAKIYSILGTNGRRFIDGDVSLGDILRNLPSETYALVKKGNYRKYIDGILYISFVKITPYVWT